MFSNRIYIFKCKNHLRTKFSKSRWNSVKSPTLNQRLIHPKLLLNYFELRTLLEINEVQSRTSMKLRLLKTTFKFGVFSENPSTITAIAFHHTTLKEYASIWKTFVDANQWWAYRSMRSQRSLCCWNINSINQCQVWKNTFSTKYLLTTFWNWVALNLTFTFIYLDNLH